MAREVTSTKQFCELMLSPYSKTLKMLKTKGIHKLKLRVGSVLYTYKVKNVEQVNMLKNATPPHITLINLNSKA
ncbi:MAG: 60S ribosomal protein L38 [Paramarteilia canceri]